MEALVTITLQEARLDHRVKWLLMWIGQKGDEKVAFLIILGLVFLQWFWHWNGVGGLLHGKGSH